MATVKPNDSLCYIIIHNNLVLVPQVKNIVHYYTPRVLWWVLTEYLQLNEYSTEQYIEIIYICVISLLWDQRDFSGIFVMICFIILSLRVV